MFGNSLMIPRCLLDDQDLMSKPKSIILIGYILSDINKCGGLSKMTNKEMEQLLQVSKQTIIDYLNLLEDKGYIKRTIVRNSKKEVVERVIQLNRDLANAITFQLLS